jgi:hypothetical protein
MFFLVALLGGLAAPRAHAQKHPPHDSAGRGHPGARSTDSAFRALQERGRKAMGVDQYTSIHRFDDLADGGRIELQRAEDGSAGVATIRAHLRSIKSAFESGDFSTPAFVHMGAVPGADVMGQRRGQLQYEVRDLPRGAALRIRTRDAAALSAVREFMAFQRREHRAAGADSKRKLD